MSVYKENVPPPLPVTSAPPSRESSPKDQDIRERSIALQKEEKAKVELERTSKAMEEEEKREKAAWSADFIAAIVGSKAVRLVTIVIGLLVGTYLGSNLFALLSLVESPNPVVRIAAMVLSVVLALGIVVCLWYACCIFRKLPSFTSVTFVRGQDAVSAAKKLAVGYISKFPAKKSKLEKFDKPGISLSSLILELKELNPEDDGDKWLKKFEELQERQGKIAESIIKDSWKSVGIKTAACPWRSADALIVFVHTTMMVASLAQVYHRRMTKQAAFRYVVRWLGYLYISGRSQDLSESCVDMAGDMVETINGIFTNIPFLKQFIGKAAEGGANAYMTYRLGKYAMGQFKALKIITVK